MVGNQYRVSVATASVSRGGVQCTHTDWSLMEMSLSLSNTASMAEHQRYVSMKSCKATLMAGCSPTEERLTMLLTCPK